jgi:hypothetical protein
MAYSENGNRGPPVTKPPGLLRIVGVVGTCAVITLALGSIHIVLGILSLPIMYEISESFLND